MLRKDSFRDVHLEESQETVGTRLAHRLERFARLSAVGTGALATAVLLGWMMGSPALKSVLPGAVAMNPVTAVLFLLAAIAAWLTFPGQRAPPRSTAAALSVTVVLVALLRLLGYLGPWDSGIDRLIFPAGLEAEPIANRMAPNTALAFILIGTWLLAADSRLPRARLGAQIGLVLVLVVSLVTVCGYAYNARGVAQVADYIPMALHTGFGFALLAAGLLCSRPEEALVREFAADALGGRMARALLPALVAVPFGLGWLRLEGERFGLYDAEVGTALLVSSWILVLTILVWIQARSLNAADLERRRNEERIASLNAALHARADELEAVNRELESFSYSVSHDLRAPLRSITSFSQALLEDCAGELDDHGRDYLERVVRAGRRMAVLIDDILGLSRVARQEIRMESFDLSAAAREVLDDLRAADPGRHVEAEIAPDLVVEGDPRLLRLLLQNLLANAWKFTGTAPRPHISLFAVENGARATFCVRDNGAGYDMQYSEKLFGLFQRLHRESEFPGTGVGLATVQRIVHRHGGKVWAEAAVGEGASFYFQL